MKYFTQSRFLIFILGSFFLISIKAQTLSGTVSVAADPNNQGDYDYASLQAVFDDISANDLGGDLIIELQDLFTVDNLEVDNVGDTAGIGLYSITIRPEANAEGIIFNGTTYIQGGGSQNIRFDGRPGGEGDNKAFIFRQTDNSGQNGAIFIRGGARNITINNSIIESDNRYGVRGNFAVGKLIIDNNEFTTASSAGYQGTASGAEYFRIQNPENLVFSNNLLYGLKQPSTAREMVGLFIQPFTNIEGERTFEIYNNVIELTKNPAILFAGGIRFNQRPGTNPGDEAKIYHNTIVLSGEANTATLDPRGDGRTNSAMTFGIARDAKGRDMPSNVFDARNNIIVNSITNAGSVGDTARHMAFWVAGNDADLDETTGNDSTNFTIDFNNASVASGIHAVIGPDVFEDPTQVTYSLTEWNGIGAGTNTTQEDPEFQDATGTPPNFQLNIDPSTSTWQAGTNVGIDTDINGIIRKFNPTKGAYELAGILEGIVTVAADPNNQGDNDYATLQEALNDVVIKGLKDDYIIELEDLFSVADLAIDNQGDPNFTTTIRPMAGAEGVVFNGTTYIQGSGAQNIILDGRPGGEGDQKAMNFRQADNAGQDGAIFMRAGASNITIKYSIIESDQRYGIRGNFAVGNLVIDNNEITTATSAGYQGTASGAEYLRLQNPENLTFSNNLLYGLKQPSTAREMVGVFIQPFTNISTTRTFKVYNNVIELTKNPSILFAGGIRFNLRPGTNEGDAAEIYHNTIVLRGEANTATLDPRGEGRTNSGMTFGIARDAKGRDLPSNIFDVRNNIIVNSITNAESVGDTARHMAIWVAGNDADLDGSTGADLTAFTFDNNNASVASSIHGVIGPDVFEDPLQKTYGLVDWQALNVAQNTTDNEVVFTDSEATPPVFTLEISDPDNETWYVGEDLSIDTDILGELRNEAPTKGAYEFSPAVLSTDFKLSETDIIAYPNPIMENVYIKLSNDFQGDIEILLYNSSGQILKQLKSSVSNNQSEYTFNVADLRAGQYFIMATDGKKIITKQIVKLN